MNVRGRGQVAGSPVALGHPLITLDHALTGLEKWDEITDAYRQFLDLLRERGQHDRTVPCVAGLARAALAQGDTAQVQVYVEEVLSHMETDPALCCTDGFHPLLRAVEEPLWTYVACSRVLQASSIPPPSGAVRGTRLATGASGHNRRSGTAALVP